MKDNIKNDVKKMDKRKLSKTGKKNGSKTKNSVEEDNEFLTSKGCNKKFRENLSKLCDEKGLCIVVLEPGYFDNGVKRFGKKKDGYAVVYDYEKLAESIARENMEFYKDNKNYTSEDAISEAYEWIDFNTLRGIQYMSSGNSIPSIVVYTDEKGKEHIV